MTITSDDLLREALKILPEKPADTAKQPDKKGYSEQFSNRVAEALAQALRDRGASGTRPSPPGDVGASGAERRLAGGIGEKKVDVSWATEEAGLLVGVSVKSINFVDRRTGNYQKNLTNRRGDMLFEAVTLHRRFPYAVLGGFVFLDWGAADDGTARRKSTLANAHEAFRLFTGRTDPQGREEQYEKLFLVRVQANKFNPQWAMAEAGRPETEVSFAQALDGLVELVAERNADSYEALDGNLKKRQK